MAKTIFLLIGCGLFAGVAWSFLRPLWQEGFRFMATFVGLLACALLTGLVYFLFI
jgi:hypothetical protein